MKIKCPAFVRYIIFSGSLLCDYPQKRILLLSRPPSPDKNRINSRSIETHHVIFRQIWFYGHIGNLRVLLIRIAHHHIYPLVHYVSQVIDLVVALLSLGEVDSNDDIRPHFSCQSGRVIITQSTINQNHSILSDRSEHTGNGHRGAHGIIYLAAVPYLCLS